jgi:TAT-translocated FGD2 family F420-dependent dehydrogenase
MNMSRQNNPVSAAINRRTLLKSAGLLIGASTLASAAPALASSMPAPLSRPSSSRGYGTAPSMLKPMVGFMLAHEQFPVPELVELGITAEAAGFDLLANSDHLQPWQSDEGHAGQAWITMSALGQRTRTVWIGPTVTCPTFRYNPAVVAEAFASLSRLYPGRIFLGVGSGEALNEEAAVGTWPKLQERVDRFIEATHIIRQLWTGEQVAHKGRYYDINARLYDPPVQQVPLLMAANGPKAMNRAGRYGDGLITDPKTWKHHKGEFESGAKAAGKDPRLMPVLVEQFVVVGDQTEAEAAARLWNFIPQAFQKFYNVGDPRTIQRMAQAEIPLKAVYSEWPMGTDPEVHVRKLVELFKSGVTIVNVHSGQEDQRMVIDFYGKHVLPRVREEVSRA